MSKTKIELKNEATQNVVVSFSAWEKKKINEYTKEPGSTGTWNRIPDPRGYLFIISEGPCTGNYYVKSPTDIVIHDAYVTSNGKPLTSIGDPV